MVQPSSNNRRLIVFATSALPDPYVNCITYGISYLGVSGITIALVADPDGVEDPRSAKQATQLFRTITLQLEALSRGEYLHYISPLSDPRVEKLNVVIPPECYRRTLGVLNTGGSTVIEISVPELYQLLQKWSKADNIIFDVTALRKSTLVDVSATLLALDTDALYSFELKRLPRYDQNDLFHLLELHKDYVYRNLFADPPVQQAARRLRRWTLQTRTLALTALLLLGIGLLLLFSGSSATGYPGRALGFVSLLASVASISAWLGPFVRKYFE